MATAKKATATKAVATRTRPRKVTDKTVTIPPAVDEELGMRWDAFKASGDGEAREKLILHYAPLVKYVASRVATGADRGEQVSLIDTLADKGIDPTGGVESQETRGLLAAAINSLSEREKIVVTLYYFEGLTLAEIGEILGVTESRVCQIHTKAVGGLRGQLTEQTDD